MLKFDTVVDESCFPFDRGMIMHGCFTVSGFAQDVLNATFFSEMAARAAFKEEESRNLGKYLDDSKAENEKMSKKRKTKKTSLRKH